LTICNSQASRAAEGTGVNVIKRKIFLDDSQNEAAIRRQFNRAVDLARRNGSAIAIGHPHPATINVLQQMLPQLPSDVVLVRPSMLLGKTKLLGNVPTKGNRLKAIKQCKAQASLMQNPAVIFVQQHWQQFFPPTPIVPVAHANEHQAATEKKTESEQQTDKSPPVKTIFN
jgi:hypothetical protein